MKTIKTQIIPDKPTFVGAEDQLDYEAICFFAATNFFLEKSSYYKGLGCLQPATEYCFNEAGAIVSEKRWFDWHYTPRQISLQQAVEEFAKLFEQISHELVGDSQVVLPLSGGLDSRSQAVALRGNNKVHAYSYQYPNGIKEAKIGETIAHASGFEFTGLEIPHGYLWDNIEEIAALMNYGGDLTASRQSAFMDLYPKMGEIMYLGHWGDVLFDDMGVSEDLNEKQLVDVLVKKMVKQGGMKLATTLWNEWGLSGDFQQKFRDRIEELFSKIDIKNNNARVRAFKSMYWAPRWTSMAMPVFAKHLPVKLPYYDDRMCRFICSMPEEHLAARRIQIEYIKSRAGKLASIPWQPFAPLNLYNYQNHTSLANLPNRVVNRLRFEISKRTGLNKKVMSNWELQFLGDKNDSCLQEWLFENEKFSSLLPKSIVKKFYDDFAGGRSKENAHAISTFLTLSLFSKAKL